MAGEVAAGGLSHKVSEFILIASIKTSGISLAVKILKNKIKVIDHKLQEEIEMMIIGLEEKTRGGIHRKGKKKRLEKFYKEKQPQNADF